MKSVFYYSTEPSEFVSRELGWKFLELRYLNELINSKRNDNSISHVLLIGNNYNELKVLDVLNESSVWVYLYADETYTPRLNRKLVMKKSVKGVIRAYPTSNQNLLKSLVLLSKSWLVSWQDVDAVQRIRLVLATPRGIVFILRKHFVSWLHVFSKKPSLSLLPGYTNLFARTYHEALKVVEIPFKSFLDSHEILMNSFKPKKYFINFVGQEGKWWRQYAIWKACHFFKSSEFFLTKRVGFGGTSNANGASSESAKEYLEVLRASRFTLCPPGNYSYGSFRILESLLAQSIPILSPIFSWDSSFRIATESPLFDFKKSSWGEQFTRAREITDIEGRELIRSLLDGVKAQIDLVNQTISGY